MAANRSSPETGKPGISEVLGQAVRDPRVGLMLLLGFACGLPFLLVFGTLSAWLREAGISRTEIGLLSWVALAYSFKFLWAPVVDRVDPPLVGRLLGRRRGWMLTAQAGVAVGLVLVGLSNPAASLWLTIAGALITAFSSATQDIVVDGWRIDAAPSERQGTLSATYQLGYRFALIASGAGALYIADFVDWRAAYWSMAALMAVGMAASLAAPGLDRRGASAGGAGEASGEGAVAGAAAAPGRPAVFRLQEMVIEPFSDLVRRYGKALVLMLPLVALYRVPDFIAGVMANPLYIDVGFSKTDIANVSKLYGVWVGIAGAFAGGLLLPKLGMRAALVIGGIAAAGSNLMFALLAARGPDLMLLTLSISLDNFAGGFAGTVLIAYMSSLTGAGFAATQYALLSSLYALPGKLVAGLSGLMVDSFGYPAFFIVTSSIGIPVAILAMFAVRPERTATPDTAATEGAAADASRAG